MFLTGRGELVHDSADLLVHDNAILSHQDGGKMLCRVVDEPYCDAPISDPPTLRRTYPSASSPPLTVHALSLSRYSSDPRRENG